MNAGSVTTAMTRTGPAQRGQYLKSIANTRRRRCIQVMGAVGSDSLACSPWPGAGGEDWLSTAREYMVDQVRGSLHHASCTA